jgi:hypothetical protein
MGAFTQHCCAKDKVAIWQVRGVPCTARTGFLHLENVVAFSEHASAQQVESLQQITALWYCACPPSRLRALEKKLWGHVHRTFSKQGEYAEQNETRHQGSSFSCLCDSSACHLFHIHWNQPPTTKRFPTGEHRNLWKTS